MYSKGKHLENPRRKLLSLCTFLFRWVLVLFVGLLWMRGPYLIPSREQLVASLIRPSEWFPCGWLGIRFSHQELKPWLKPERALASSETRVSEVVRNRLRNHPQQVSFPKNPNEDSLPKRWATEHYGVRISRSAPVSGWGHPRTFLAFDGLVTQLPVGERGRCEA